MTGSWRSGILGLLMLASAAQAQPPELPTPPVHAPVPDANGPAPVLAPPTDAGPMIWPAAAPFDATAWPALMEECARPTCWFNMEYILWWLKDSPQPPPLGTRFPGTATSPPAGALGDPDTAVVIGGSPLDLEQSNGGRFTFGSWFSAEQRFGGEVTYMFLARHQINRTAFANGSSTDNALAVPYFNPLTDAEAVGPLLDGPTTFADFSQGFDALTLSVFVQGTEANGLMNLYTSPWLRIVGLAGFRWFQLEEKLSYNTTVSSLPGETPLFFGGQDRFDTENNFCGGQLGIRGELNYGPVFLTASSRLALGNVHQELNISGVTLTDFFFDPVAFPGGVFSQPSNLGAYQRDRFAVLPELNVNLGYAFTPWCRVFAGYSFLYLSNVLRPGNTIDRVINPTTTGFALQSSDNTPMGPIRPLPIFKGSDFWAQGVNFGAQIRY